ncbi:c-type cytochrome [Pseudoxanthomonas helianthi]|uniref:C-type cytochrome n=1 Tax=Pseudoxanthomonas helianthi TaxID=1453541 RepID=A0A940X401_9GAMM|nr:c-type cytochrome [Pseudoxanthomonas helianthi]MBP3983968.1 c-type cytochrome [Pseudoxanthomonas helianthi]
MKRHVSMHGALLALAFAGAGCSADAQAALRVCVDSSSPGADMDLRLAEAVARDQGTTLAVHRFDGEGDDEGFDMKNFVAMAGKDCQLVLGFPLRDRHGGLPGGLHATQAYARTGFVLVTPMARRAASLDALRPGTRVAVTYQTTPNLYFAEHPALQADIRLTNEDAIDALEKGKVQAAMLWRPTVVKYLSGHGQAQRFDYAELDEPHARYDLVALYADANAKAAQRFEASIARLGRDGKLSALLQPYAVAPSARKAAAVAPALPAAAEAYRRKHDLLARADVDAQLAFAGSDKPSAGKAKAPALFTAKQATGGKASYEQNCAICHGDKLTGRAGPALKGKHFAPDDGKYKVGDIFAIVHKNMPAMAPGSLPQNTYVEIMAYILQQNGYPAGGKPLTFDGAKSSKVPLIYAGQ